MTNIYLHGELGEKFGTEYILDVGSVPEAVRALVLTKPGFSQEIEEREYQVFVGDPDSDDHEELEEQTLNLHTNRDIHIIPVIAGAKKGLGKTILGAVLMAVAIFVPIPIPGVNSLLFNIGLSMTLRGISMMLSPQPDKNDDNHIFQNDPISTQQGTPIPVLYGEMLCDLPPISVSVQGGVKPSSSGLDYGNTTYSPTTTGTDGVSITGTDSITGWQHFGVLLANQLIE